MELKETIDFAEEYENGWTKGDVVRMGLELLVKHCHAASYNRGWWHDPITGESLIPSDPAQMVSDGGYEAQRVIKAWFPYVIATKIALIHSEVSEGLEAYRVDGKDDKIPFPGITAEMADAVIRIADLMGCLQEYYATAEALDAGEMAKVAYQVKAVQFNLGVAILAKLPVNVGRPDHDISKRAKPGGKKF